MKQIFAQTEPRGHDLNVAPTLFPNDIYEDVLLSVHLLGKPTVEQLYRLNADRVSNIQSMRTIMRNLSGTEHSMLSIINPIDLNHPSRRMPYVYLDTTKSRRHIESNKAIPFRRPPKLPSRDWRFLRHDVELVDPLVSFELTARTHSFPFGYERRFDVDDKPIFPRVELSYENFPYPLRPKPDAIPFINGWRMLYEYDCGEETIGLGRPWQATVARKTLVYDQMRRMGVFDLLGWDKVCSTFIVNGKKKTARSSRKRITSCIEKIPDGVDRKTIYFVDRQSFMETGDDVSILIYVRGDGEKTTLPCFW